MLTHIQQPAWTIVKSVEKMMRNVDQFTHPISGIWLYFDDVVIIVGIGASDIITIIFVARCCSHIICYLFIDRYDWFYCDWLNRNLPTKRWERRRLWRTDERSKRDEISKHDYGLIHCSALTAPVLVGGLSLVDDGWQAALLAGWFVGSASGR